MSIKTPLSVFIVWHPDYSEGQQIADFLYSFLCRDSSKPLIRSMGIPVYFRGVKSVNKNQPIAIDFTESEFTAVIALVSDEFVVDKEFGNYLDKIFDECNSISDKRRVYPIAISKNAFNVSTKLTPINFIRVTKSIENDCNTDMKSNIFSQIKSPILHELCRLLMNMKKATTETDSLTISPPLKLFISHSKHDDSKLDATKFRDYINSQTQLKTFFDTNDIAYGSNFGDEIKKVAHESALVVFQSDSYADREWCRIEVLEAKSAGCSIVIVNAVQNGEKRAFPYLGNYPSIRFKNNFLDIIDLTLEQVLFNLYTKIFLDSLTDMYEIKADRILSTSPELFNFIQLKEQGLNEGEDFGLVVYPDPPLGSEEMEILNKLDSNFIFITPLTLPLIIK
ncbi:toll/interleukin-1 receptor domain-containing protein [Flavobacterium sp. SUN046]|uniref:toll/interleukin-1 receptor domain-containing protein n=1 Tax=Flavobacterium sp. SUN046 TaxID=3002440 RepID=UPI002DBC2BF7|nr:toll/interleukin-1 receptor domain-containing protein [Flavobacterium sp. SUN046]MEC4048950.1 toll/interleukin-1 receptor domain-containing protein [Flavobacterium sp. SUN046]